MVLRHWRKWWSTRRCFRVKLRVMVLTVEIVVVRYSYRHKT
jgi:hypothetical protein